MLILDVMSRGEDSKENSKAERERVGVDVVSGVSCPGETVDVAIASSRGTPGTPCQGDMSFQGPITPPFIMYHRFTSETARKRHALGRPVKYNVTLKTRYLDRKDSVEDNIPELACGQDVSLVTSVCVGDVLVTPKPNS